jgi:hypothetical protein
MPLVSDGKSKRRSDPFPAPRAVKVRRGRGREIRTKDHPKRPRDDPTTMPLNFRRLWARCQPIPPPSSGSV